ncbi:MAG: SDR family NAD(P)-dependent oxidoreductase [Acidobacteriota bacterium]
MVLNGSEIAIIGMSCRFPGARNIDQFWQNLCNGVESITFLSDSQLEVSGVDPVSHQDPSYVKAAAIVEAAEMFDAAFFGYSPREAEVMDPQHRLLLECAWEALEQAGYNCENYPGAIGVYAGARANTYLFNIYSNPELVRTLGAFQIGLGNDPGFLTTRISYKLNLKGPSYTIHTACSTALVAVHLACQSLLTGECSMALAGGIAINIPQKTGYLYQHGGIVSPDGHCRAFDANAQGTVFGSGAGLVLLKRLEDAVSDGDTILAVIKGSATNNDGALKASFTAPSVNGQAEVILEALANAEVDAATISYIETHGTGTAIGDPIEIRALTKAFRVSTESKNFCAIGSVKTNLGHLDAAAGIASLIKAVLALKNGMLPPSLHYREPNPQINFHDSPFYVNECLSSWNVSDFPRRAGVSSFGIGGTNAHIILEQAPLPTPSDTGRKWQLLLLSAKTGSALELATANLTEYLKICASAELADITYTLQVGRKNFPHKRLLVCCDRKDAINALESQLPGQVISAVQETGGQTVVFMFPGQGSQYVNMGLELYRTEAVFREQIDQCSQLLELQLGLDLRSLLYPSECDTAKAAQRLAQTEFAQPALFTIEYAIAQLWISWGVKPKAMLGHSVGEYVAACLSGVFSLEDALSLVCMRGKLMQSLPVGAMLAVNLPESKTCHLLNGSLSLAAVNGEAQSVIAGPLEDIASLQRQLESKGIECHSLATTRAFHSTMVDPIVRPFEELVSKTTLRPPQIPFISNVNGQWIEPAQAMDPSYWSRHLRQTVRFSNGIDEIMKEPGTILIEVGPGQSLGRITRHHWGHKDKRIILASLPGKDEKSCEQQFLMTNLGKLWLAGYQLDWTCFYQGQKRHRLHLPTYPFERKRYWIELKQPSGIGVVDQTVSQKKPDITDWIYLPSWKRSVLAKQEHSNAWNKKHAHWLLFADQCGLWRGIAERLQQMGHTVMAIIYGERFSKCNVTTYTINPRFRDDYNALIDELVSLGKAPDAVLHLWSITEDDRPASEITELEMVLDRGFYSLMFLMQALGDRGLASSIQIDVVSNNLHEIVGVEAVQPEKVLLLGMCKVIPREYMKVACRSIDILLPETTGQREKLIDWIITEIQVKANEAIVAYRGGHRWVQIFEPVKWEKANIDRRTLKTRGVYLITGGLGGVGLVIAEYLAKKYQARLILTGRSTLPARENWAQWLESHGQQDHISKRIRTIEKLEAMGTEILAFTADVANAQQMRDVFNESLCRFGEINGVIHAAGVAGGGLIQIKTPETVNSVIAPKAQGLIVLDELSKDLNLDFLVLFSSISALLGEFGQSDYCAANAFLDSFASRRDGTVKVSINWGTWKEVGMAVAALDDPTIPLEVKARFKQELALGMDNREALELFEMVLSRPGIAQVIVCTRDLQSVIESTNNFDQQRVFELIADIQPAGQMHARPNLHSDYVPPSSEMEKEIVEIWQQILGIEQIGVNDDFFELGGHSLLAARLVARLRENYHIDFPLGRFFEYPTIATLTMAVQILIEETEQREEQEILMLVEELSDEEVRAEIKKRKKR